MWFQYKNHNSSYNFFFHYCLCQNTLQFWPSCQRILLLLSKSVKTTILLQNRTLSLSVLVKGLFCLPLLKDSFFYCSYQRDLYFIALVKGPFFFIALTCGVDHILNDWLSGGFALLFRFLFVHFFHFFIHIKPSMSSGAYSYTKTYQYKFYKWGCCGIKQVNYCTPTSIRMQVFSWGSR